MGVVQSSNYCLVCNRQSMFQKQKINHVLHFVISLFTFGLWIPVWITLAIINGAKSNRCATCGSTQGAGGMPQGLVGHAPVQSAMQTPVAAPYGHAPGPAAQAGPWGAMGQAQPEVAYAVPGLPVDTGVDDYAPPPDAALRVDPDQQFPSSPNG